VTGPAGPSSVSIVRAALASALRSAGVDRVYEFPNAGLTPPAAEVALDTMAYDAVMRGGGDRMLYVIRLYVGRADDRSAVLDLDAFLSSVPAAINDDPTLATACHSARVTEARNYGAYQVGESTLLGVEFLVDVVAKQLDLLDGAVVWFDAAL
jgi:hypothetical protein